MTFKKATMAIMISAVLAGCGSGDSEDATISDNTPPPTPPTPPEDRLFNNGDLSKEPSLNGEITTGVYRYTVDGPGSMEASETEPLEGIAIISNSGRIAFALEERTSFSRIQLNENNRFDERLQDTEAYIMEETRRIRGGRDHLSNDAGRTERVIGSVVNADTEVLIEKFKLEKQVNEAEPISLAMLSGTYTQEKGAGSVTRMTFNEDGSFSGEDSDECELQGETRIPDAEESVVEMKFTVENCLSSNEISADTKNGDYFAVGRFNSEAQTLQMFSGNDKISLPYSLVNINAPGQAEESAGSQPFANKDFDVEPSIEAKLKAGIYQYTDIPLEAEDDACDPEDDAECTEKVSETGMLMLSPTGRAAVITDRRVFTGRAPVNELDRFEAAITQSNIENSSLDAEPETASKLTGMPYNTNDTGFLIVGSLIDDSGSLLNRYEAAWLDQSDDYTGNPLNIDSVSGTYVNEGEQEGIFQNVTSITINNDGTVTGQDTLGCTINGEAIVPGQTSGLVEMTLELEQCGPSPTKPADERNGTYGALGAYVVGDSANSLELVVGNAENSHYIQDLVRQ